MTKVNHPTCGVVAAAAFPPSRVSTVFVLRSGNNPGAAVGRCGVGDDGKKKEAGSLLVRQGTQTVSGYVQESREAKGHAMRHPNMPL